MDPNDQPAPPVWAPGLSSPPDAQPTPAPSGGPGVRGVRRGLVSLAIVAGLLGVGGVAAVYAASPDPSASSAPSTTAPSTTPAQPRTGTGKAPCDGDGGGSSGGSSNGSNGSSGTNPTPTTAPAATPQV